LPTIAIGKGTVRLKGHYGTHTSSILLKNMLHIPATRSNLISGVQLDKAGVTCTLGNNTIFLSVNDTIVVEGILFNDMYRLNLHIILPKRTFDFTSLASRISIPDPVSLTSCISAPLSSRLGPQLSTSHAGNLNFYIA
jgi:hypothetical protein